MREPTLDEIINARDRCAKIISLYGDRYLPIFERLDNEISTRQKKRMLLEKAVSIGNSFGTHNGTQNGTQIEFLILRITKNFNKISVL